MKYKRKYYIMFYFRGERCAVANPLRLPWRRRLLYRLIHTVLITSNPKNFKLFETPDEAKAALKAVKTNRHYKRIGSEEFKHLNIVPASNQIIDEIRRTT